MCLKMIPLTLPTMSSFYLCAIPIISCLLGAKSHSVSRLGQLNVNKEFITVSGFSSGGTMAQQLYISYSSLFSGIAIFSHTFYRCGTGNGILRDYDAVCTTMGNLRNYELYHPNNAVIDIQNYFRSNLIEDPNHLANKPLYIFAGTENYLFTADMSLRILHVFEPFIRNQNAIKTRVSVANLTLPSDRTDLPACAGPQNSIQIANCGFSGALESLQFLLGKDAIRPPSKTIRLQPLIPFDQKEFFYGTERNDMDSIGYVYVPKICQSNKVKCLLHIYFHGCSTGREFVGPSHILHSGFLEVAEKNGIIIIFPQAISSYENTIGCWDTFGVTGPLYATQKGAQVAVLRNILYRVLGLEFVHESPMDDFTPLPVPMSQTHFSGPPKYPTGFYETPPQPPRPLRYALGKSNNNILPFGPTFKGKCGPNASFHKCFV